MQVAAVANGRRRYRKFYPADAEALLNAMRYNPTAARIRVYSRDGFTRFPSRIVVVTALRDGNRWQLSAETAPSRRPDGRGALVIVEATL